MLHASREGKGRRLNGEQARGNVGKEEGRERQEGREGNRWDEAGCEESKLYLVYQY